MNHKLVRSRAGILAVFVVLAMAVTGCGILSRAEAPEAEHEDGQPTASVSASGFGEATGAPDMATVQLGVETEADTIAAALDQSNQTVDSVTTALLGVAIAETDIQSFNFNVWPEEDFDRLTGQPTGERTYHVDSTLSVVVRDINRVSETIQAGLDAGATNIWGLTFGIDDTAALQAEAREKALQDAQDRAQQLADAIGVTLGKPLVVSELVGGGISPFMEAALFRGLGGGGGPPLSPGELTVSIQVDVMYAIER